MSAIPLSTLLDRFPTTELAEALFQANLPQGGTKAERIERLCTQVGQSPQDLLDLFRAEALREACRSSGIRPGRKDEMIVALVALLEGGSQAQEIIPEANRGQSAEATVKYMQPTKDEVITHLRRLSIPSRKLRAEADAEWVIGEHLGNAFEDVVPQYNIGGYLGLKIDIDIGNGKVGVEVKLADSLLKSASEIHRLIGQSIYYQRKRYMGNLVVAIAGHQEDLDHPMLKEAFSFLESFAIPCIRIPAS